MIVGRRFVSSRSSGLRRHLRGGTPGASALLGAQGGLAAKAVLPAENPPPPCAGAVMSADQKALAVISEYAPKIIEAHEAVQSNAKTMMEHAIVAGELLAKAKKKVGHGKWAEWVQENCKFSARTASDYMRMAEHKKQIGRASADSICGALKTLAKPKPEKKEARLVETPPLPGEPAPKPWTEERRWTEEDHAAQIVRDVEASINELRDDVDDIDLLRELVLQKLTFALQPEKPPTEETAKRRGRPPGAKNKPKEPANADPYAAMKAFGGTPMPVEGNGVDPDASAEARKAMFDEAPEPAPPAAASPVVPEDGSIPDWLKRDQQDGRAA